MLYIGVIFHGYVCSAEGSDEAEATKAYNAQFENYAETFDYPKVEFEDLTAILLYAENFKADGWIFTTDKADAHKFLDQFLE